MKVLLTAATLVIAGVTTSVAADHDFTIQNGSSSDLTALSISGGKVAGFKTIRSGQSRTVTVTLADGKCEAGVRLQFADGSEADAGAFDFCTDDTLPIEDGQ